MSVWQTTDAAQARTLSDIEDFLALLELHDAKGYIGEVGIPNNADIQPWAALLNGVYDECYANDIWVTQWGCAQAFGTAYPLSPFVNDNLSITHPLSVIKGAAIPLIQQLPDTRFGVALSGLEFSNNATPNGQPFSNTNPGTLNYHYFTNNAQTFSYLKARGIRLLRIGFSWEPLQPTLGGVLNTAYLQLIKEQVFFAGLYGIKVILDLHNYGRYVTAATASVGGLQLGAANMSYLYLANVWQRLSDHFKGTSTVVAYDLMNEPYDMPGSTEDLVDGINLTLTAIRNKGDGKLCMCPMDNWSKLRGCTALHEDYPFIDSADNIRYSGHLYPDIGQDSTFSETYAANVADAVANGF